MGKTSLRPVSRHLSESTAGSCPFTSPATSCPGKEARGEAEPSRVQGQEGDAGAGPALPRCHPEAAQALGGEGRAAGSSTARLSSCSRPYRNDPSFNPEFIKSKSTAAAGLCSWCLNMVRFYEVHCTVKPKRQAVADADAELAEAQARLSKIKSKIVVSVCPHSPHPRAPQSTNEQKNSMNPEPGPSTVLGWRCCRALGPWSLPSGQGIALRLFSSKGPESKSSDSHCSV